jgi:hypothetical protein
MAIGKITKQPYEELDYAITFAKRLAAEDTIQLVSCTSTNVKTKGDSSARLIAATPAPVVSGQQVNFRLIDGTDGERHKLTVRVEASTGEKLEDDVDVHIKDE